jgi:hypothetical protein
MRSRSWWKTLSYAFLSRAEEMDKGTQNDSEANQIRQISRGGDGDGGSHGVGAGTHHDAGLPGDENLWAAACLPVPAGHALAREFAPSVGVPVWVEFEEGDPSRPVWTGFVWGDGR